MSAGAGAPSRTLRGLVPHLVLVAFSASILLPLVWLLRVALTDKLTAYRIPPELAPLRLDNFVEIFVHYNFSAYFLNSIVAAVGSTAIALPLATAMAYAFARHNTGGSGLRLVVLASQMLPPVILVLPMYSLFLMAHLLNTWTGLLLAHLAINIPFLAWILIAFFQGDVEQLEQAARIDGATRLPGLSLCRCSCGRTRPAGCRHPGLHLKLERIPLRTHPNWQGDQHTTGRARWLSDPARRRHRASFGSYGRHDPTSADRAAVHAAVPHQRVVAGRYKIGHGVARSLLGSTRERV